MTHRSLIVLLLCWLSLAGWVSTPGWAAAAPAEAESTKSAAGPAPAEDATGPAKPTEGNAAEGKAPSGKAEPTEGTPTEGKADDDAAPEGDAVEAPSPPAPPPPDDTKLRTRAARVRALIDGTLAPSVDAEALFRIDLSDDALVGPSDTAVAEVLQSWDAPPPPTPPEGDTDSGAQQLAAAYRDFFALPPEERAARMQAHATEREAWLQATARDLEQAKKLDATADQLQALLDGTLDPDVDPKALLQIDLGESSGLATDPARRERALDQRDPATKAEAPAPTSVVAKAQARVDALRWTFLRKSAEERKAILATHAARRAAAQAAADAPPPEPEAELPVEVADVPDPDELAAAQVDEAEREASQARAERQAALEAARLASSQLKREIANERARLLGVKEAQAHFQAELNRKRQNRTSNHELAAQWQARVDELAASTLFDDEKAAAADPLYEEVRAELADFRDRLRDELDALRTIADTVPAPGEGLNLSGLDPAELGDLPDLRAELTSTEEELVDLAKTVSWEIVVGLRDDVVTLNASRLRLLAISSADLRSRVTGFGADGVDQVRRELDQIRLVSRVFVASLGRLPGNVAAEVSASPIPMLFSLAQLAILLVVWLWWRRRGARILAELQRSYERQHPATRGSVWAAMVLWYLQRIRRPLERLAIVWIALAALSGFESLPSLDLVWGAAAWFFGGRAAVLLIDALAARDTLFSADTSDTSALRIHSLHVVGFNVILVGLVLSLSSATVGKGAIYSWVLSTCWVLSFPVVVYLIHRWRTTIFTLYLSHPHDAGRLRQWVADHRAGPVSYLAAAIGGASLLGSGIARWTMRQLSGFEATRRLLAYLFRREVARQAASAGETALDPIEPKLYERFDPERLEGETVDEVATEQLAQLVKVTASATSTLSAVVGERGSGKSSMLQRLVAELTDERVRVVDCPRGGFTGVRRALARTLEAPDAKVDTLREHLRAQGTIVVCLDNAQRLVQPAIRGLTELDRFTEFARSVGSTVSWVITMGTPAWNFMRRARGDRLFFEHVVRLPQWSEEQLGKLIRERTDKAGISPSFDGLAVPKQAQAPLPTGGNRTEHGYHRLLWDFSRGNPAVALQAWRESLFVRDNGELVVRLFKEPPPEEIESLPLPILFVLRAIVQLELAPPPDVIAATQLPATDVADALRFCRARAYIEDIDGSLRLSWRWYRTITTVLQRQHLLSL